MWPRLGRLLWLLGLLSSFDGAARQKRHMVNMTRRTTPIRTQMMTVSLVVIVARLYARSCGLISRLRLSSQSTNTNFGNAPPRTICVRSRSGTIISAAYRVFQIVHNVNDVTWL